MSARTLMAQGLRHRGRDAADERLAGKRASPTPSRSPIRKGIDEDGKPFDVPETKSVVDSLTIPALWSGPTLIIIGSMVANVVVAYALPTSVPCAIGVFAFFRLAYNVGLGVALHYQSHHRSLSRFASRCLRQKGSLSCRFIHWLAEGRMRHVPDFDPALYPDAFVTWLAFKTLVDLILVNDGLCYLILVTKCWNLPDHGSIIVFLQYVTGILLIAFNYWAKVDAHRCIGDYSWYWGDNFFILEQNLTFDGIFGYSWYYGLALLSQSYVILIVSLIAHMLQIGFLVFVENPHIDRTYGGKESPRDAYDEILYDPVEGLFPNRSDALLFLRLDPFRPNDVALVILSLYMVAFNFLAPSPTWSVVHAAVWMFVHWVGIGLLLRYQRSWKNLYNLSRTLYLLAFVLCALRYCWIPSSWADITKGYVSCLIGGIVLVLVTFYSVVSSHQVLGDFATFYGDFFIPTDFYQPKTRYVGIYRFLNNPECVTGYAGLHGMALITQSWTVFWLAFTAQALNFIFIKLVEVPHMEKIYSGSIRREIPAEEALMKLVREHVPDELLAEAERVQERATRDIFLIYKRIASSQFAQDTNAKATVSCPDIVPLHTPMTCTWRTNGRHPASDWLGIYKVDVESAPGMSRGRWIHVPDTESCSGEITFPVEKMPSVGGVYELRYHTNHYNVIAKAVFCVHAPSRRSSVDSASRRGSSSTHLSSPGSGPHVSQLPSPATNTAAT
ncbi:hypothetical protein PBRA_001462 [Plasmodiophora brassicae]|uniref:Phosphatidylethanolamine N-methyltransferase n=1 Tax=Plasmodiophora brassicae TaxID=37360 RepID=A0A0G4IYH1_PLABS|nr:hypothetical protein PBRA_001462 [Plasmodiophora brassicae]